jgi:hypothetical protein
MHLRIGKRHTVKVSSVEQASAEYSRLRTESGEGASTWPDGRIGHLRISYNGNVWDGDKCVHRVGGLFAGDARRT